MPIQILPARLANQIAAGEVVERPASVVKELIENSLDAGATRIDIDIEQGGAKCIRIKDNGSGVDKEQLTLALSRHATSKISHLDDLESIHSLGFRGEALASVSSVSRLTFTSKTSLQAEAWQAIAEGRDMQVNVQPAAHPQGTTVEVLDLFFNTPARRRFLKTEKTEFQHIDELIKRIALSRFDVAITLKHNNRIIRQYRAAPEQAQQEKRIAAICSEQFIAHAVFFEHSDQHLKISGWVSERLSPRPVADVQYCYINGRMIRDKLVNHAIKQVYSYFLPQGMFPGYIIYIECDAKEVDVNVHPAKHEVRFHQARWVHDFISSTLNSTLNESSLLGAESEMEAQTSQQVVEHAYQPPTIEQSAPLTEQATGVVEKAPASNNTGYYTGNTDKPFQRPQLDHQQVGAYCDFVAEAYRQPIHSPTAQAESLSVTQKTINVVSIIDENFALLQVNSAPLDALTRHGLLLLSMRNAQKSVVAHRLFSAWQDGEVIAQPLLLPVRFKINDGDETIVNASQSILNRLGFHYKFQSEFIIVSQVPAAFRHAPIANILPRMFAFLAKQTDVESTEQVTMLCDLLSALLMEFQDTPETTEEHIQHLIEQVLLLPSSELPTHFQEANLSLLTKGFS